MLALLLLAQSYPAGTILDEAKVAPYRIAPVTEGVASAGDWRPRRAQLLDAFAARMYGRTPAGRLAATRVVTTKVDENALAGTAIRRDVELRFAGTAEGPTMRVMIFYPKSRQPVPVFAGLSFSGNEGVLSGKEASRWPFAKIVARGYAVATAHYGDLAPDNPNDYTKGILSLFGARGDNDWAAIGAWAWGMSRMLDYLETDPRIDARRVIVHGHSRLGKAALWAGAQDERFAAVISNDSGAGGAALSKRVFGETVKHLNDRFPHWFAPAFRGYNDNERELPFDQHQLLALVAPRPLYVCSAAEDLWADPQGEFLATLAASPAWGISGVEGLSAKKMPAIHEPALSRVGYHIRAGKHDVTDYDWEQWMNWADRWVR